MTDINELTAKLKAAALAAKSAKARLETSPDIDVALFDSESIKSDVFTLNKLVVLASPANVLALTEALEAAQSRIAELEARTLTVKLPDYVDGNTLGYGEVNHMIDLCADAFEKACYRAGIKLQIEGE